MKMVKFEDTLNTDEELVTRKLEQWANEISDKVFIYYGENNKSLTYKQFNEMANSFANQLRNLGIKKGDRISVFLKNSLITTISMFGIWKAGAVFCPINFNYNGKLLSYQLNDTKPQIMITERQLVPIINEVKDELPPLTVVVHDPKKDDHDFRENVVDIQLNQKFNSLPYDEFIFSNETNNPNVDLYFYDIASIIYTSGTTGPAKGAVQSYRWIHGDTYVLRLITKQDAVVYNDLPLYHVGGAYSNVARTAFVGATVAIWDKFSSNHFWKRIEASGATHAILLDVMIPWLMKAEPTEKDRFNTLNCVHMQPLPEYHHQVAKRFGFDFVTVGYSQTESCVSIASIIDELENGESTPHELYNGYSREEMKKIAQFLNMPFIKGQQKISKGYMGSPLSYYEAAILNDHDEECKPGELGQLVLRPRFPELTLKEYFNKPDKTVESFRNLWFHTGDIAYKDKDGVYYFVDRMNDVIRHKGENISSFQVEDLINQHENVSVCAAFPIPAEEGDEDDIVVFVVPKKDPLNEQQLKEWTKNNLPKFMWPKYIRIIKDMPKTPTNKIEKFKLKSQILKELGRNR